MARVHVQHDTRVHVPPAALRGGGGKRGRGGKGGTKRDVEHTRSRWVKLSLSLGREGNSAAVLNPAKLAKLRYYYSTD